MTRNPLTVVGEKESADEAERTAMDRDQLGEWLSAYLDGELTEQDATRVESVLEADSAARDMLEALRATSAAVGALSRRAAPDSIAHAIRADLERGELLDGARPQAESHMRTASTMTRWATAAVLGFAAIGSLWVIVDRSGVSTPSKPAAPLATNAPSIDALASRDMNESIPRPTSAVTKPTAALESVGDTDAVVTRDRGLARAPSPTLPMHSELPLTMEHKLALGVPSEALQSHRFANEPNRLIVRVSTPDAQRRMASQVRAYLAGRKIANLEDESEGAPPKEFFKPGRAGVNVYSLADRQVLVRATPTELSDMVAQLGDPDDGDVVLVLGGVDFSGGANVQEVFRRSGAAQASNAVASSPRGLTAGAIAQGTSAATKPRREEAIESFVDLVGGLAAALGDHASARDAPNDESADADDLAQTLVKKDEPELSGESHTTEAASPGPGLAEDGETRVASEETPAVTARDTSPVEPEDVAAARSKRSVRAKRRAGRRDATAMDKSGPSSVAAWPGGDPERDAAKRAMAPGERSRLVDRRLNALESARKQRRSRGRFEQANDDDRLLGQDGARARSASVTVGDSQANQLITLVVDFVIAQPRTPPPVKTPEDGVKAKAMPPAAKPGQDDKPHSR